MLQLEKTLLSCPVNVNFLGFKSDTLTLGHAGWGLSMQQLQHPMVNGYQMRLALEHPSKSLYAISWSVDISEQNLHMALNNWVDMGALLQSLSFEIAYMAPAIQFHVMPETIRTGFNFAASFEPVDPRPQMQKVDMRNFKFFRIAPNNLSDIILLPEQVPEALNKILEVQSKQIDEIKRREKQRENFKMYEGMLMDDIPKGGNDIKAQIVVVGS